jgi:hypothetical protein
VKVEVPIDPTASHTDPQFSSTWSRTGVTVELEEPLMAYVRATISKTILIVAAAALLAACGDDGGGGGGDADAAVPNCAIAGMACTTGSECCTGTCDEEAGVCAIPQDECLPNGAECGVGIECCSFSCVDAKCSGDQCTDDGDSCDSDGECCGGSCVDGSCAPLNGECRTSGNSCTDNGDCCSGYCEDNVCDPNPSFCRQSGDVCASDFECCGGKCGKADGEALGTCTLVPASGAGGCLSAGEVCGGVYDGGDLPTCGGECCSRACLPYGPTGVLVCQPPSGCRPTGEVCASDDDCCGSANKPDGDRSDVRCSKVGDNPLGRCDAGNACTPAGGICKLMSTSCNENANCCAGNTQNFDTCRLDNLGIPRCTAAPGQDCTNPEDYVGEDCATSADCCGLPCTPSGSGEFPPTVCGGETCVDQGGVCTNNADCCAGLPCVLEPGSTQGLCGDTPGDCTEYGQECTDASECCSDLPCEGGTCGSIIQ